MTPTNPLKRPLETSCWVGTVAPAENGHHENLHENLGGALTRKPPRKPNENFQQATRKLHENFLHRFSLNSLTKYRRNFSPSFPAVSLVGAGIAFRPVFEGLGGWDGEGVLPWEKESARREGGRRAPGEDDHRRGMEAGWVGENVREELQL